MYDGSQNDARLNREILIRELRENPPEWWDFTDCEKCAIEVSKRLGLVTGVTGRAIDGPVRPLMLAFGLSHQHVCTTFYHGLVDKTPAIVADELEAAPFVSA